MDPDIKVREFTAVETVSSEVFISRVYTNLSDGRLRLIFFADRIPDELQRIVDFLNRHLRQEVEVFAFEFTISPLSISTQCN